MKRRFVAVAVVAVLALPGCVIKEVQVGVDPGCRVDADCAAAGGGGRAVCDGGACVPPADPVWGCLDGPPLEPSRDAYVDVTFEVVDSLTKLPRVEAVVNACARFDSSCASPFAAGARPGPDGRVTVRVAENFDGYFEVYDGNVAEKEDAVGVPDFVPMLVFFPPREILRKTEGRGVLVFAQERINTLAALGSAESGTFDDKTGLVITSALTCEGRLAAGVSFELKTPNVTPNAQPFYTIGNLPILTVGETDGSGTGGFTTVKPGLVQLGATLNSLQRSLTPPKVGVGVFVRAGWYTQLFVSP
jgi:hypothetical protein